MARRSFAAHRARMTWAMRSASHTAIAWDRWRSTKQGGWVAAGAASVGVDAALSAWLARDDQWRPWPRLAVEMADAGLWGWATRQQPIDSCVRFIQLADVLPTAIESATRAAAGVDARPPVDRGPLGSPDAGVQGWIRTGAVVGVTTFGPLAALVGARRLGRGQPWLHSELIWPFGALGLSAVTARMRHRLQVRAVDEWRARATGRARQEARELQLRVAAHPNVGHDFAKTLHVLGYWGSPEAAEVARQGVAHPQELMDELSASGRGCLLGQLTPGIDIEPSSARWLWLEADQAAAVRRFLDHPDVDDGEDPLRVAEHADGSAELRLNDRQVALRPPLHRVRTAVDPLSSTLVTSIFFNLLPASRRLSDARVPPVVAAAAALCDLAALISYRRRRSHLVESSSRVLALTLCGAAIVAAAEAAGTTARVSRNGSAIYVTTGAAASVLGLIGYWWDDLGPKRWLWLGATLGVWAVGMAGGGRRCADDFVTEGLTLYQSLLASRGLGTRFAEEGRDLEEQLPLVYETELAVARDRVVREQLDLYREYLDTADGALHLLRDHMPSDVTESLESRCATLGEWLEDPSAKTLLLQS